MNWPVLGLQVLVSSHTMMKYMPSLAALAVAAAGHVSSLMNLRIAQLVRPGDYCKTSPANCGQLVLDSGCSAALLKLILTALAACCWVKGAGMWLTGSLSGKALHTCHI